MSDIVRSRSSSAVQVLLGVEPTRLENKIICLLPSAIVQSNKTGRFRLIGGGNVRGRTILAANSSEEGGVQSLDNLPMSIIPESILSETQFDGIVGEAQQRQQPVVIIWMAGWCRKCIYLKPKLEKLAAEYFPRIRFFDIDVNNVSHKLVVRAGVTKMPTIQLWKDGEKQGEVIGGHKAHLVVNEIREMIENAHAL